ncbi:hypothetical protein [Streptomyces sp. CB01881]|uniref:hypothetical protein n=1 Tax=Streptomyces sp. CB01881 TaxID=2078691 RepID=UPI001F11E831|nr:hypothetical protein [Streptomyces sp. CB01881]
MGMDHEPVRAAGRAEGLLEGADRLGGDRLVGTAPEREDRRGQPGGELGRAGGAVDGVGVAVEADHRAGQAEAGRRRPERLAAAEAEAERDHLAGAVLAQPVDPGADVGVEAVRGEGQQVGQQAGRLAEFPGALFRVGAGGAPEIVDRQCRMTLFGEPDGGLPVETRKSPVVRQDEDGRARGILRSGQEGAESGAVPSGQGERGGLGDRAGRGSEGGGCGGGVVTHGGIPSLVAVPDISEELSVERPSYQSEIFRKAFPVTW